MRTIHLAALLLAGCTFAVPGVFEEEDAAVPGDAGPGDEGGAPTDGAAGDGPASDLLRAPDLSPPPPRVLFEIDARSRSLFSSLAQPWLPDYAGPTQGHFRLGEAVGAALDSSGSGHDLAPVGGAFSGRRGVFTHIPDAAGGGFVRVGTEFAGAGFAAGAAAALDVAAQDFTVETWFKLPPGYKPTSAGGCDPLVAKGPPPAAGYALCAIAGGRLRMAVSWGAGGAQADTTAAFDDGAWHLGTFVFAASRANAAAAFIDGAAAALSAQNLQVPPGRSLASAGLFTVGGDGKQAGFHGSLAEVAVHIGRATSLAEHQAELRAFAVPSAAPLAYARTGTLCATVETDGTEGERVACYGAGQAALAKSDRAPVDAQNAGQLGLAITPAHTNYAATSEQLDAWSIGANSVVADGATSPRGDRTAEVVTVVAGAAVVENLFGFTMSGPYTFSIWLRGHRDGDHVFFYVTDGAGSELTHCMATLSLGWRRYPCTHSFSTRFAGALVSLDGYAKVGDALPPLSSVTFDAWGAQLEAGPAATPYTPNATGGWASRGAVVIGAANAPVSLDGKAGRAELTFAPGDALVDGAVFLDTGPTSADRHTLRRGTGGALFGEVLDGAGAGAADSPMTLGPVDWTRGHLLSLAWDSGAALAGLGALHSAIAVDGSAVGGRAAPFTAGAPAALSLLCDGAGKNQPAGTLQRLRLLDSP